jgi:magnesium transporter
MLVKAGSWAFDTGREAIAGLVRAETFQRPGSARRSAGSRPLGSLAVTSRVVDRSGVGEVVLDPARLRALGAGGLFWLDLHAPDQEQLAALNEAFGFHPLALEDSSHFNQRSKLEDYEGFSFLVLYGHTPDEDDLVEVHLYVGETFVVTVRRDESPSVEELYRQFGGGLPEHETAAHLLYRIADALVDSFFPALSRYDDRLELIEDDLIRNPKQEHLQDVFAMRRRLARLRRVISPQRDLLGRIAAGANEIPGMTPEVERYFRDVYDHLIRLGETLDVLRELMTSAVDVYLSAGSNRLGEVTKQLAVIATIFLPLTFITGFFGQNFGWMVEHVDSLAAFLALGVGLQLAGMALLLVYFKRRGWY